MTDEHAAREEAGNPTTVDEGKALIQHPPRALLAANDEGFIKPTTIEETVRMAKYVILGGLAPDSYKTNNVVDEGKVVLGLMSAMEAGLPPLYGLRQIAIINNRPTIWGDGAIALVQRNNLIVGSKLEKIGIQPVDKNLQTWDDSYGYRVTFTRRGQEGEYVGEFTVGHARRAGLWMNAKKQPWILYPDRMLFNRARAFALRDGFADALGGIAIREEIEDTFEQEKAAPPVVELRNEPLAPVPPMPGEANEAAADGS